nr:MAG TPA: hypothetical protein [Caudoviricetes sp.]DAL26079.1 MAG TPA_asm: hypothetical protein [Bacteriophage sp.]DAI72603.1 MAG TPA: hypothetical protein [Caudoviricetes sp.]DAQ11827.1 MAG TPA: hypothetical protein [Caudoviricetes sp.]DAR49404.1 MAG TPA: hypothetical protein [Caudoviricetes sp.]
MTAVGTGVHLLQRGLLLKKMQTINLLLLR